MPSKSSFRYVVRISVARRLCANTISCRFRLRNSDATRRVFAEIRTADAELMVDDRRVDEDEELLAARRAALVDELERLLGEPLGELARVRNRRRRAEKDRVRSVVPADAAQPPQHVAQVAAEDAAVGVQLVDDHVAQVLEQLRPARMVREDARMHHVGIAEHEVGTRPNRAARVLRRIAVVREDADAFPSLTLNRLAHRLELGELILRQRLGRKQIQRAARRSPEGSRAEPARCNTASCPTRSG